MNSRLNKDILFGVTITLTGSMLYVLMSALSKITSQHLITNQIIFLQSLSGLACSCCFLKLKKYHWRSVWTKHRFAYLTRMAMSLASIYAFFYGLRYITIFNALVVLNSAPLVIPILRRILFKKKIHVLVFPATISAFAGILLILSPDRHIFASPIIIIIVSMLCMSFSLIILEKTQANDANLAIFYYFFYSSIIATLLLIFQKQSIAISFTYGSLGVLIGVLFFFVQLTIIYAANYISSHLISVLFYAEIIISLFYSMLLENVQLTSYILTGTLLVLAGGIAVTWIENKSKQALSHSQQSRI